MIKNDRKTIFGWCMYDWANSAYVTTVVTALLPVFFVAISPHWEKAVDYLHSSKVYTAGWQFGATADPRLINSPVPAHTGFAFINAAVLESLEEEGLMDRLIKWLSKYMLFLRKEPKDRIPSEDEPLTDALKSPIFEPASYSELTLTFNSFFKNEAGARASVKAYSGNREPLSLIQIDSTDSWQEFSTQMQPSDLIDKYARIHFEFESDGSDSTVWAIDDITLRGKTLSSQEELVFPEVTFEPVEGGFVDGFVTRLSKYLPFLKKAPEYKIPSDFYLNFFGRRIQTSPTTVWGVMVSFAAFFIFICAPLLGAIADFSAAKKKFLMTFAYSGSLFAILLYFCSTGDVRKTMIFFLISQIGFVGANVFYDSFLPHIATEDKLDWVSGKGFCYGYIGGGLQFAIALGLVAAHKVIGIDQGLAARIGMTMAGFWWAGFTLFTLKNLKEAEAVKDIPEAYQSKPKWFAYTSIGVTRLLVTAKKIGHFKHLLLFLIAFMIYNDGIQTVINMATIYGKDELGLSTTVLMITLFIIQIIAAGGALLFSQLAGKIGTKYTVMLALALWSGVVTYAYFIHTDTEFFILGIIVGIVLGGSQALSRSFYGSMVPEEASAEFYGFYSVFSKFSAIWGPLAFAVIRQVTGTAKLSILSIGVFFIVGLILLAFVDEKAAREAKFTGAF